mgnify:CR=1 FL=1
MISIFIKFGIVKEKKTDVRKEECRERFKVGP